MWPWLKPPNSSSLLFVGAFIVNICLFWVGAGFIVMFPNPRSPWLDWGLVLKLICWDCCWGWEVSWFWYPKFSCWLKREFWLVFGCWGIFGCWLKLKPLSWLAYKLFPWGLFITCGCRWGCCCGCWGSWNCPKGRDVLDCWAWLKLIWLLLLAVWVWVTGFEVVWGSGSSKKLNPELVAVVFVGGFTVLLVFTLVLVFVDGGTLTGASPGLSNFLPCWLNGLGAYFLVVSYSLFD